MDGPARGPRPAPTGPQAHPAAARAAPRLPDAAPADPRHGSATLTPHLLRHLVLVAAGRGCDLGPALERVGLCGSDLELVGRRISYRQASSVIREAIRELGDPGLGLAVGRRQRATSWGLVGFALLASPTLRDALELGLRHHGASGSMLDYRLRAVPGGTAVLAAPRFSDSVLRAFLLEEAFGSIVALARDALGPCFAPRAVSLRHSRPAYGARYEQWFACPVAFGAREDRLDFPDAWLDHPLPGADAYALAQTVRLLDAARARDRRDQDLVQEVEVAVARSLPRVPTLARQALARGMSERTLRRRLAAHGTTYQALVDSVRLVRAEELITTGDLPFPQVAARLGFGDTRALRRAVARWFGTSPSALRRSPAAPVTGGTPAGTPPCTTSR
ncbi:AraC family transcriptional regulator [Streptomyces sp. NPDC090026]|uniref:AraC family transcriptional regulator n=1 Tax=Streptomyces sp. NPDC090026 TaxID=3365923 RepID=UPI00380800F5